MEDRGKERKGSRWRRRIAVQKAATGISCYLTRGNSCTLHAVDSASGCYFEGPAAIQAQRDHLSSQADEDKKSRFRC